MISKADFVSVPRDCVRLGGRHGRPCSTSSAGALVNNAGSYHITPRFADKVERDFGRIVFLSLVLAERGGEYSGAAASAAKREELRFAPQGGPRVEAGWCDRQIRPSGLSDADITGASEGEHTPRLMPRFRSVAVATSRTLPTL